MLPESAASEQRACTGPAAVTNSTAALSRAIWTEIAAGSAEPTRCCLALPGDIKPIQSCADLTHIHRVPR